MDVRRRALGSVTLNKGIKYLTIEALEDGLQAKLSGNTISYSLDSGTTWVELLSNTYTPSVNVGQYIMFKASGLTPTSRGGIGRFTITKKCNLLGNCNSLLFGDEVDGNNDLTGYDYAYRYLFSGCTTIQEVSSMFLPATTLTNYCYYYMFYGCTSLVKAPVLPATTLSNYCYYGMFYGTNVLPDCNNINLTNSTVINSGGLKGLFYGTIVTYEDLKNILPINRENKPYLPATSLSTNCYERMFSDCKLLVNAPELPSTTLAVYCYSNMFRGCTSLVTAPALPATTMVEYCYDYMFYGCTSLVNAPELPATTLATACYRYIFQGCTSLVTAPELPATSLRSGCYVGMFSGCTSLVNAPELPATTLVDSCYSSMFRGCASLVTAPVLPAITLANSCYNYMFYECANLNYIKALFTTTPTSAYTNNWVYKVSVKGTFVKNPNAAWDVTGINGVPNGWEVRNINENYLTIKALEDGLQAKLSGNTISYSKDGGTTWVELPSNTYTPVINSGQYIQFKGNINTLNINQTMGMGNFTINKQCELLGNCNSLLFGDDVETNTALRKQYAYVGLFKNCTNIIQVSKTFLPATTLSPNCYYAMFNGCISLVNAPELPATTLATNCYQGMFQGCTSLINAPELPATTLVSYCYSSMFQGCTSLVTAPELPATTLATYCYVGMFNRCTSLVKAPELPATTLASNCYNGMFRGCTSLTTAPVLPATTLISNCYYYMFNGCTNLNYIKALFTTTPTSAYTNNWVYGVSVEGTFVKNPNATWDATGVNGVPNGWVSIIPEQDIYPRYMTIEVLEDGLQAKLSGNAILYSIDSGTTWVELPSDTYTPSVDAGSYIMFKGKLNPIIDEGIGTFTITQKCNLLGNCNSLLFGDEANGNNDLSEKWYNFYQLFLNCVTIQEVSETFLPATVLSESCYDSMFTKCTSLTKAPELPATVLNGFCYSNMFQGCTSLVTSPKLPATTLAGYCYYCMFRNCTSLATAPELPATALTDFCYTNMFQGCASLISAPQLPAVLLTSHCYESMFQNCTSLILTPKLPANNITISCYESMFQGCTSLVTAPELPAPILVSDCYKNMFNGCSKLNYVRVLCFDEPTEDYSKDWLLDVSYEGTFVKRMETIWNEFGTSSIPFGWRVIGVEENTVPRYMTVEALSNGLQVKFNGGDLLYSLNYGSTWVELPSNTYTPSVDAGSYIMFKGNLRPTSTNGIGTFTISRACNLLGNCNSLLFGDEANGNNDLTGFDYVFRLLFNECSGIQEVSETFLPATTLASNCYSNMFKGCASLVTAPELPATTLANYCYQGMFYECTSLTTAPELPATTLVNNCYTNMFNTCTSLTTVPELPATTLATSCYSNMFRGCTSLITAPELPATTLATSCYQGMFNGCTSLVNAPELPAKDLVSLCYNDMFNGCSKLNYVKALFVTYITSSSQYTTRWLSGVTSNGTFIKNPEAPTPLRGDSTIPSGWTIKSLPKYLTIEALEDGLQVKLSGSTVSYSLDSGTTWSSLTSNYYTPTISKGKYIMFKSNFSSTTKSIGTFTITKKCNLLGNCNSLLFGDNATNEKDLSNYNYAYNGLFRNCTTIQEVSKIFLPATTLSNYCYANMFIGCTSLTKAPELPATTLTDMCYYYMFNGCTSLLKAPVLPATTLSHYCYGSMFSGCTSLISAPELPATTLANGCYFSMFNGCISLTKAPKLPATTLASYCYNGMFKKTSLTKAPELPATTLVDNCYSEMFYGCGDLKYIKALFTTNPSNDYTENWVLEVGVKGVFVKNTEAEWDIRGNYAIPVEWAVYTCSANSGINLTDLIESEILE